ncbi:MAG: 1-acyl-sn-glycerol-3-phosphate acyltransferase [Gammaproteobacteria bacterium]|nr:1-acyl-sn-glycerol-3-phosphate acyltransferase [Gammaproteobacteria bacterium]NND36824.1 1-acyl-sn-glycerol-3-phosphate acyltransferase [Gammaproteobacteria bacterium]
MIRSLIFTSLLFLTVPPWAIAAICVRIFGRHASFKVAESWVLINLWFCKTICGLDMTIEGAENVPDDVGVLYIKHSSAYETLAQFRLVGDQTWVLKRELLWAPFFGWAVRFVHPIAIDRKAGSSAVQQIVEQGTDRLANGIWVVIYPEGTRMAPGTTRRYGASGALLAQKAGKLITPVAHNAGYFWPRRGLRKKPGTVRFVIGPPVDPAGRDVREVNREIQDWIESKVAEIAATDE